MGTHKKFKITIEATLSTIWDDYLIDKRIKKAESWMNANMSIGQLTLVDTSGGPTLIIERIPNIEGQEQH